MSAARIQVPMRPAAAQVTGAWLHQAYLRAPTHSTWASATCLAPRKGVTIEGANSRTNCPGSGQGCFPTGASGHLTSTGQDDGRRKRRLLGTLGPPRGATRSRGVRKKPGWLNPSWPSWLSPLSHGASVAPPAGRPDRALVSKWRLVSQ